MELLCKKSCWYEDESEYGEEPFVIQGELYKVTEICGNRVEFINALGYSHKWHTSDPEFHEYLELVENTCPLAPEGTVEESLAIERESYKEIFSGEGYEPQLLETNTETAIPYVRPAIKYVMDDDSPYGLLAKEAERTGGNWSDKHYDFKYKLTEEDIVRGFIDLDVYFVANVWRIGSKDNSGALWHSLKTIARFGDKNSVEREVKALYEQVKGLARSKGVKLDD